MGQHPAQGQPQGPDVLQPLLYRARNLVERFFNKAKQFRRITTRYDKLAENYLAALKLVSTRIWLRGDESTS
ncbi:transposase [Mesorhizobium sp. M0220]|uniref:transposase n=1 Tax=Mesorhizobium sp. M0220 TaxID=2956920 RepID=UPI003335D721